jgi:hypothetical protein
VKTVKGFKKCVRPEHGLLHCTCKALEAKELQQHTQTANPKLPNELRLMRPADWYF